MIRDSIRAWCQPRATLVRSDGPTRVVVDEPAPDGWEPPPLLGFAAAPTPGEQAPNRAPTPCPTLERLVEIADELRPLLDPLGARDPLLWEGDQA